MNETLHFKEGDNKYERQYDVWINSFSMSHHKKSFARKNFVSQKKNCTEAQKYPNNNSARSSQYPIFLPCGVSNENNIKNSLGGRQQNRIGAPRPQAPVKSFVKPIRHTLLEKNQNINDTLGKLYNRKKDKGFNQNQNVPSNITAEKTSMKPCFSAFQFKEPTISEKNKHYVFKNSPNQNQNQNQNPKASSDTPCNLDSRNPKASSDTPCNLDSRNPKGVSSNAHGALDTKVSNSDRGFVKKNTDSGKAFSLNTQVDSNVIVDTSLFENEINKSQIVNFKNIYNYRDIKFYMNIYHDYKKSDILEVSSYWMGILDGPIKSKFQEYDILQLLNNETFIHNLKFCLILFVYNPNIEYIIREKVSFPLIVYPLKKFNYFTNETDLLFEWNEKLEIFTIGYEFNIQHFIEKIPNFFYKSWLIFDNDFPLKLSDFCIGIYGADWIENIRVNYNVHINFLKSKTPEQVRKSYEICFKLYKQSIFYISYDTENVEKYKSNWYYECFSNGTPILTNDVDEFSYFDYFDNSYNLFWTDSNTSIDFIRNTFNTKNISKMSSLIYKWKKYLVDSKSDIVEYFKFIHYTLFKIKNQSKDYVEQIVDY